MEKRLPKKWVVTERQDPDLLRHLLRLRGITDPSTFLAPRFADDLHDPLLMKGMAEAVTRLTLALAQSEQIGIFADYDTDGTPGAALLVDGLEQLGGHPLVYIPTRTEGYGLSPEGIDALADAGAKVIITIDVGITGQAAATHARHRGIDLIVTDHHLVQPDLFPAAAFVVINPKQADCPYPFKELCGGGIVWKLLGALVDRLSEEEPERLQGRTPEAIKKWSLDLAAISTICDMVPLVDENRIITQYGLKVLQKTRRAGLQALFRVAGTNPEQIRASTVGFQIGPRINAPTRMAAPSYTSQAGYGPQCSRALALLLTQSTPEATQLAEELHQFNRDRQAVLESVLLEAITRVEAEQLHEKKVIFIAGSGWPVGIVGLVAGRLMERYGRPAIVLSIDGDLAVGSARSIEGFHLVDALGVAESSIQKFGGHAKAAGLTVAVDQLETVYQQILAYADQILADEQLGPQLRLEAALTPADVTLETARTIDALNPHGIGNPRPVFLLSNLELLAVRPVGREGTHAKVRFRPVGDETEWTGIGFGLHTLLMELPKDEPIDLAVQFMLNTWQGQESLEFQIIDARLHPVKE
ncbi:single-stranded-DNA-specific exonuclease RecJ, partial [Candidatus Berkelbacteria bacterium]|nr:single-stranded-DNA-specific exonuclease RecJ [Candidatus Berkelbacteria bacterium]